MTRWSDGTTRNLRDCPDLSKLAPLQDCINRMFRWKMQEELKDAQLLNDWLKAELDKPSATDRALAKCAGR